MKKVLFLMFLLLLMGLGTANVKAQVRIGGNAAPNAAAALDLNATDATDNGTKGLALPRVSLTNVSTALTGTPVVNGMMIYNTNASTTGGSGVGIYYWDGSSSKWVKVINSDFTVPLSKLVTTAADSGKYLISNGSHVVYGYALGGTTGLQTPTISVGSTGSVNVSKFIDATVVAPKFLIPGSLYAFPTSANTNGLVCWCMNAPAYVTAYMFDLYVLPLHTGIAQGFSLTIRCFAFS